MFCYIIADVYTPLSLKNITPQVGYRCELGGCKAGVWKT